MKLAASHIAGRFRRHPHAPAHAPEHVRNATETVAAMERKERDPQTFSERISEYITAFSGSLVFVWLHILWFGAWIGWNSGLLGLPPFDEFPFTFLTLVVSLEAIFLATFVLITQNRQTARADKRALVDLQVNLIAERELTKILKLVADIHGHLSETGAHDPEVDEMLRAVHVDDLQRELTEAESRNGSGPHDDASAT